jgi:hypothetical protein
MVINRPGREADHSLPSSAEVKNTWSCTSTPPVPSWRGAQLKHRDNFTFTHLLYLLKRPQHFYMFTGINVLNELCFWTLSIVWCLKKLRN